LPELEEMLQFNYYRFRTNITYLAHSTEPEQCLLYTTTTSSSLSSPEHKKKQLKLVILTPSKDCMGSQKDFKIFDRNR
jgi:hypothetical protein